MSLTKKGKILITGGTGLLGINWACQVRDSWIVVSGLHEKNLYLDGIEKKYLQYKDFELLFSDIKNISPDYIIHTAGMTHVDSCEKKPDEAEKLNCELTKKIAEICRLLKIQMVHISTDHLYDGNKPLVSEQESKAPVNVYGKTKSDAEEIVLNTCPNPIIVRTNFYGWGSKVKQSFTDWLIENLRNNIAVDLFDNVFYTPVLISHLVEITHQLMDKEFTGVINISGNERISKSEFGLEVIKQFQLDQRLVSVKQIDNSQLYAKRPNDMSLSNRKLKGILGDIIPGYQKQIQQLRQQEINGLTAEIHNSIKE